MFSFFNKGKSQEQLKRPLANSDDFYKNSFSNGQKAAVMLTLEMVAVCDGNVSENETELANRTYSLLGINPNDVIFRNQKFDEKKHLTSLLFSLNSQQKRWYIGTLHSMICADGPPNDVEIKVVLRICKDIGITETEYIDTIKKIQSFGESIENKKSDEKKVSGFENLFNIEQKVAFITSLRLIAACDGSVNDSERGIIEYVAHTVGIHPFAPVFSEPIFKKKEILIDILNRLPTPLKSWCVIMTHTLVHVDDKPKGKITFALEFWEEVGITSAEYNDIIETARDSSDREI